MSRHRVKAVSYDEDDYDDGYYSPDPEEQEFLEQCTTEVLNQLRAGDPSVIATRSEVQDALYHYYDDIEKSVNYLRGACFRCQRMNSSSPGWYPVAETQLTTAFLRSRQEGQGTSEEASRSTCRPEDERDIR